MTNASTSSGSRFSNWRNACSKALRSKAGGIIVAVVITAITTTAITRPRAPRPPFDRFLFGLEGDGYITLSEPGLRDGEYRVPVGTRCRLYRLYLENCVVQLEDGRLTYADYHELLEDTPANRDLIKDLRDAHK